jgi:uncharacterized membrane protein YfcA
MNVSRVHLIIGTFFLVLGGLLLMQTLDFLPVRPTLTLFILFFTSGLVFILVYFLLHTRRWMFIVGGISLFIGSAIGISQIQNIPNAWISLIFFLIIGFIFLDIFMGEKRPWWPIIPSGFAFIFATQTLLELMYAPGSMHGVIFFGGIGLIFGILFLTRNKNDELDWSKYPSLIAFLFAGIILFTTDPHWFFYRFFFPLLLIGIGILIIRRTLRKNRGKKDNKIS